MISVMSGIDDEDLGHFPDADQRPRWSPPYRSDAWRSMRRKTVRVAV